MQAFIDIHSHILPNLDDGAADMAAAVETCRYAIEQGVADIIATPHAFDHVFNVSIERREEALGALRLELDRRNLKINILAGFECRIHGGLIGMLQKQPEYTLCGKGKHFLLEFDSRLVPPDFEDFLFRAHLNGLQPILVHPERNVEISGNMDLLEKFIGIGLQIQVTAGSVIGLYGHEIQRIAQKMIKRGFAHYVASDIHPAKENIYRLRDAYTHVCSLSGEDVAGDLFFRNQARILKG